AAGRQFRRDGRVAAGFEDRLSRRSCLLPRVDRCAADASTGHEARQELVRPLPSQPARGASAARRTRCGRTGMTKHVLITGGAGFICSHLSDAIIERRDRVTIIENLSGGDPRNLDTTSAIHQLDIPAAAYG